jgi:hypothetical protein
MNQSDARSLVTRVNGELLKSGLAIAANPAIAFPVGDRVRLSWPEAKNARGMLAGETFASLSEYRRFVQGSHYTCLLNEGSLIQISFEFKRNELIANRFCFYPCPLVLPPDSYPTELDSWNDVLEKELMEQIEALEPSPEIEDSENAPTTGGLLRFRSPFRFDFDRENDGVAEPCSHLHVNSDSARIPVFAPLSVTQFLTFVLSHYFPSHSDAVTGFPSDFFDRTLSVLNEHQLHINCRRPL